MPTTSPDSEHFHRLADQMICNFQVETIRMCHANDNPTKMRHAAEAYRIASIISRHLTIGLQHGALF